MVISAVVGRLCAHPNLFTVISAVMGPLCVHPNLFSVVSAAVGQLCAHLNLFSVISAVVGWLCAHLNLFIVISAVVGQHTRLLMHCVSVHPHLSTHVCVHSPFTCIPIHPRIYVMSVNQHTHRCEGGVLFVTGFVHSATLKCMCPLV